MRKKERALWAIEQLKQLYPDAHCALHYENSFQLLIATILSAQCTDERVNKVTHHLFKKYPTPQAFANAELEVLEGAEQTIKRWTPVICIEQAQMDLEVGAPALVKLESWGYRLVQRVLKEHIMLPSRAGY